MAIIKCAECGKPRQVKSVYTQEEANRYKEKHPCCRKCAVAQQVLPIGTKTKSTQGYVTVKVGADHPLSSPHEFVAEHTLVYWEHHKRNPIILELLKDGASIHHKNGIRDDNRPENLELMLPGRHPRGWRFADMARIVDAIRGQHGE